MDEPDELDELVVEPELEPELLPPSPLDVLEEPEDSDDAGLDSDFSVFEAAGPFVELVDDRESVMYQPLPLNTIPTG